MTHQKRFQAIQKNIEVERIKVMALFVDLDERMLQLSPGRLAGSDGIELAGMMDALLQTEQSLRRAIEYMENVRKAE
ncbi:MAG: hypothetical protein IJF39_03880 [Clostridia bacterium]|nr:hypothetical protein [Clostridia bacterium]